MDSPIGINRLVTLLNSSVERWHAGPIILDERDPFYELAIELQARNFEIWHEEDKARDPSASPDAITTVKRSIDNLNQQRNDAMERLDENVLSGLRSKNVQAPADSRLHSETVGSIVDRLSILALKIFHMREESLREDADEGHRATCQEKLAILEEQQADLATSLRQLLKELWRGRRRFKVYRQMKMYNDPNLNPVLYGGKK